MGEALEQASQAAAAGEVPVGAVVALDNQVIARARNRTEELQSPVAHAELLALEAASRVVGSWRLERCVLVVTVEPCTMCAGAVIQSRVAGVVFGAHEPRTGAFGSLYDVSLALSDSVRPRILGGIRSEESLEQLRCFFAGVRLPRA